MIVNVGIQGLVALLASENWEIAVGTGTTPAWITNETLEVEVDRKDATVHLESTNIADDTLVFSAIFTFASATTISEIGLFKKAPDEYLLLRITRTGQGMPINIPVPFEIRMLLKSV